MTNLSFIGNCTGDTEVRTVHTSNGDDIQVTSFTIAVNDRRRKDNATFFRVSCWRGLADVAYKFLRKGDKVCIITDNISARAYMGKDGKPGASLECNATELELLGNRRSDADDTGLKYTPPEKKEPQQTTMTAVDDPDLPF